MTRSNNVLSQASYHLDVSSYCRPIGVSIVHNHRVDYDYRIADELIDRLSA